MRCSLSVYSEEMEAVLEILQSHATERQGTFCRVLYIFFSLSD
jgi:hypothetical protein